ncbi:hypothetical protein FQN54_005933 [Arachnomyces sp. PD_36]|nr:hypothetical protein FQN54_005933 [Arachnomyces sp. PD_36]
MADSTKKRVRERENGDYVSTSQTLSKLEAQRDYSLNSLPIRMFTEAQAVGVIEDATTSMKALAICVTYSLALPPRDEKFLREKLETVPELGSLSTVAVAGYLASRHPPTKRAGSWMLTQAAKLGDPLAVPAMSTEALKLANPRTTATLASLEKLAKSEHDARSMVMHGLILQKRGQMEEASALFKRAMELSYPIKSNTFLEHTMGGRIPQPWAAYGSIRGVMGDNEAAEKATEIGALEYENIDALGLLAYGAGVKKDWDKYVEYTTKIAMHRDIEAAFHLGVFYLKQFYEEEKANVPQGLLSRLSTFLRLSDLGKRSLALEWFRFAAEAEHPRAALLVAALLREDRQFKEGALFLGIAEQDPDCFETARKLRDCYLDRGTVIDIKAELPTGTYKPKNSRTAVNTVN